MKQEPQLESSDWEARLARALGSPFGATSFTGFVRALRHRHGQWLIVISCIPALVLLWRLLKVLASRIAFPMDLEWIEGGQLLHVYRLLHGMDLFVEPNHGFMPYSYPPGHTLILAAAASVFGLDYSVGRAVSWLATAGVMTLLAREVYREFVPVGFPLVWAVLALGSMAAAFPLCGGWFDLIRNDEVALLLALGSVFCANAPAAMSRLRFVASTLLMTAALYTKQTAIFYIAFVLLFQFFRHPLRAIALGASVLSLSLAALGVLQWLTSGRYFYYAFQLLAQQQVHTARYAEALRAWIDFAPYLPLLPLTLLVLVWFNLITSRALLLSGILLAAFPASLLPYAKQGGYLNNLLPVALSAGPVALCLVAGLLRALRRETNAAKALSLMFAASAAMYLQERTFSTDKFVVPEARWRAAERLHTTLRGLGGSLLMPEQPFVAIKAGSRIEQFHDMAWADAWLANVPNLDFRPFLAQTRPQYVTITGYEIPAFFDAVAADYTLYRALPSEEWVPPITGMPSYPRFILERQPPPAKRGCLFDFEHGYADWLVTGNAFDSGTTGLGDQGRPIIGRQGYAVVSSFSRTYGDSATGTLTSPEFAIARPRLTLRVGGGDSDAVGVALVVDGVDVLAAHAHGVDYLQQLSWDVSRFVGKSAKLRVFDQEVGAFGHVLLDHVCPAG